MESIQSLDVVDALSETLGELEERLDAIENDKNRRVQLINTALANETDHFALYQEEYGSFLESLSGSALGVNI